MVLPEDWEINRNEDEIEIRWIDMLTEKELEQQVEEDITKLFKSLGITANEIARSKQGEKTSDYGGMNVDFEVTIVQSYIRGIDAIEKAWDFLEKNIGTCYCAYIYTDSTTGQPVFKLLCEEKGWVKGLSMLCLRQHVSIYHKKIANKIETKYRQHTTNQYQIIVLDFRITPFNPSSLRDEISKVLQEIGEDYHYLLGIIFALPKTISSSPFESPNYFYACNPYLDPPKALNEKLKNIETVVDDPTLRIMPMLPLPVIPHTQEEHVISHLCFDCPSPDNLPSQGMPV